MHRTFRAIVYLFGPKSTSSFVRQMLLKLNFFFTYLDEHPFGNSWHFFLSLTIFLTHPQWFIVQTGALKSHYTLHSNLHLVIKHHQLQKFTKEKERKKINLDQKNIKSLRDKLKQVIFKSKKNSGTKWEF